MHVHHHVDDAPAPATARRQQLAVVEAVRWAHEDPQRLQERVLRPLVLYPHGCPSSDPRPASLSSVGVPYMAGSLIRRAQNGGPAPGGGGVGGWIKGLWATGPGLTFEPRQGKHSPG